MAVFSHSPVLFVQDDGSSMEFHMRSCKSKDEIKPLVEHGGGILQLTAGPDVIRLVEPDCKLVNISDNETVLSVQYIYDCVKKNRILNFKDYLVELKVYDVSDIDEDETQSCVVKCVTKPVSEFRQKPAYQLHRNEVSSSKKEQRNCVSSQLQDRTHKEMKEQQLSNEPSETNAIAEKQSTESDDLGDSDYIIDETFKESSVEEETAATLLSAKDDPKSHVGTVTHNQNTYEASECSQEMVSDKESRLISKSVVKRSKESCENDFEPSVIKKTRTDMKLYDSEQCSLTFSSTINNFSSSDQVTDQNTVSMSSNKLNAQQDNSGLCSNSKNSSSLTLGLSQEENSQIFGSWNKCTWNSHLNNSLVSNSHSKLENISDHDVALPSENEISMQCNDVDQNELENVSDHDVALPSENEISMQCNDMDQNELENLSDHDVALPSENEISMQCNDVDQNELENLSDHDVALPSENEISMQCNDVDQNELENLSDHDVALPSENEISMQCNDVDQNENVETLKANVEPKEVLTRDALIADEVPVLDISSETDSTPNSLGTASTETFCGKASAIVKKLADIIADMQLEVAEKDVLKSMNDLNMLLYVKNLKNQVTDILKKQDYTVRDNAILLKYVSLAYRKSPIEILDDIK